MFLGPLIEKAVSDRLLQSFWDEAGSYGSRILIVPTASADLAIADRYRSWFSGTDVEWLEVLPAADRQAARDERLVAMVETATGILITDGNPLRFTSILGGTPVAQAIRRANARGRVVCGLGRAATVLCQHIIAGETTKTGPGTAPGRFLRPDQVRFAPGLGIVNRIALDCGEGPATDFHLQFSRLVTAVAHNPFLIGLGLEADTGIVVYADSTLEVFGTGSVVIVDGAQIEHTSIHQVDDESPLSITNVQLQVLGNGYTYNLDSHTAKSPPESEIPQSGYEAYTSF